MTEFSGAPGKYAVTTMSLVDPGNETLVMNHPLLATSIQIQSYDGKTMTAEITTISPTEATVSGTVNGTVCPPLTGAPAAQVEAVAVPVPAYSSSIETLEFVKGSAAMSKEAKKAADDLADKIKSDKHTMART